MTRIQYAWRRSADPVPVLYLDVIASDEYGWRMVSFPVYRIVADMAQRLLR